MLNPNQTMASSKKDKDASAPEAKECANCLAPEGRHGVTLKACTRCKATHYCGRACQTAHWKAGHKQFCVTPEERAPQPASPSPTSSGAAADHRAFECAICLDSLTSGALVTLPCTHTFHSSCVEGLRSFGTKQVCPMCRAELPPGPEQLYKEATCRYLDVRQRVNRGEASWCALTKAQQQEIDEAIRMLRMAAEQGQAQAQSFLGSMYFNGRGVKQDLMEALRWLRMAAEQGLPEAQSYIGSMYLQGQGVKEDRTEGLRWLRKAAEQGLPEAQYNIGSMYLQGQGVKEDRAEGLRWLRMAAEQGTAKAKELVALYEPGPRTSAAAESPASSSRTCANCGVAETAGSSSVTLKPCSRCKAVVYCGKACQAQHWKAGGHRLVCK